MTDKLKKGYVILVALDFENFEHYCKVPQIFYDSFEDAELQMNLLIENKEFGQTQVKVQKLWQMKS